MCGIVININNNELTKPMLRKIKHRGPNDIHIIEISNQLSMGFVRLSINDKTIKGRQPFSLGNLYGVFNGEIYNYKEVKNKYQFKLVSYSDTELLLPLYRELEDDFYNIIDGMFAGVIFDSKNKEFTIIKDLTSQKPLFLVKYTKGFSIVSELKAVLINDVKEIIDIPSGLTKVGIAGNILYHKFKNLKFKGSTQSNNKNNYDYLRYLLQDSVNKRIPNEKFGVFLSGGLDSSIITSITKKRNNVTYYSLISNEGDDLEYVEKVVNYLDIKKKNLKLVKLPNINDEQKIKKLIENVVYYSESYNPSIISNGMGSFLLSEEAKKDGIKVILSGEGADELFCGYKSFYKNKIVKENWKELRNEFIRNMYFTELRRIDLCCMANSVEARSPFLDKKIIKLTNSFNKEDFFYKHLGKHCLRNAFINELPLEVINRNKVSFDVGSGVRNILINYLKNNSNSKKFSEKKELKKIWNTFFNKNFNTFSSYEYFHSYPSFNSVISKRTTMI